MMCIKKYCIVLIILLFASGWAYSQEVRTEVSVDFRVNSSTIDRGYSNNTARLSEIASFLQKIEQDSTLSLVEVSFCGSASPEGSYELNYKLARARLETLEKLVRNEIDIPESIITRDDSYISWDILREQVVKSNIQQKQTVLDIIAQEPRLVDYPGGRSIDHRIVELQALDGGKVWVELHKLYFERMRNAYVIFITYKRDIITTSIEPVELPMQDVSQSPKIEKIVISERWQETVTEDWTRHLYLKTNILGWGTAISNIGVEVDLCKHLSFALPVYYSALNYFTSTIKFRTLMVQPELRFWPKADNQGFFVGGHFGYAQYNLAIDGNYRYQDHNGSSPALGGGLAVGYRLPFSKNKRWGVEFTIGAGCYKLHYDKFYNTDSTVDGLKIDSRKKTYWGLDQAAVSFSYSFDLKKKGGKR